MSQFYFNPIFGYPIVAVVAALLIALLFVGPSPDRSSRRRRLVLLALRTAVVVLLLLAMLRPTHVVTERQKETSTLIVLADKSRSMSIADALAGKSRFDAMQSVLNDAAPAIDKLTDEFDIQLYTFAADATPVELDATMLGAGVVDLGTAPVGEQTAIGAVLDEVVQRNSGRRLAGVVLLSDGAWRAYAPRDVPPQPVARRMADLGVPLYAFTFGEARSPEAARDLALDELMVSPTVFVKNQLDASAMLTVNGYAERTLPVQMLFEDASGEMQVVAAREMTATSDGQRLPVQLSHVPLTPGERKVTLRVAPQDGELLTTNNHASTFVTVRSGGVNVLYLEGDVRVEPRFIRSAIDASPDVQVDYEVLQKPTGKFSIGDRFEPGKYDVVILGNVDAGAFDSEDLSALAEMVRAGTGLMMIGGFHSFGPGGYATTPLAELLPVRMSRLDRQRFGEPVREDLHWPGPIKMRPTTPQGAAHPIMQLNGADASTTTDPAAANLAAWAKLPALDGANRFRDLAPTAIVLAETDDAQRRPLLVAGQPGADARVLVFAGDSTWHWQMEGFGDQLRRFWRQVVLWLAHKDDTASSVWVKLDRRRFGPRQSVPFTVGARGEDGRPVTNAQFEVEVTRPDGESSPVPLVRRDGVPSGSFTDTIASGDYTIRVKATVGGAPFGEAQARFLVFEHDLELDNPAADPALMTNLARMTDELGGKSLAPEELPDLLEQLAEQPPVWEVEHEVRYTYYDRWEFFLLFVALISAEWFLRKRWGLV